MNIFAAVVWLTQGHNISSEPDSLSTAQEILCLHKSWSFINKKQSLLLGCILTHFNSLNRIWAAPWISRSFVGIFTFENLVQTQAGPFGICDGQRVAGTGFAPIILTFPCQHHSMYDSTHTHAHTHTHTHNEITHSSPNIRVIKSRRLRLARHVARMEKGGTYRDLITRPEVKRPLRRPRLIW